MMNYNHLYYFYQVSRHQSITKAAKFLSLQQPSLSAQIKVLETQLNKELFQRVGREIRLSSEGEILYRYCQRIFDAAADLEIYLKGQSQETMGLLRIGVSEQVDNNFVADFVSHVQNFSISEKFRLKVVSGTKNKLVELLKNRELDLFFCNSPVYEMDLYQLSEVRMPVALFVGTGFGSRRRMPQEKSMKEWLQKTNLGLVLPTENLKLRHETDQFLQKFQIKSSVVFESDLLSVVTRAVVDGVGYSFLPIPYMAEELNGKLVTIISTEKGLWSHQLYLYGRQAEQKDKVHLKIKNGIEEMKKSPRLFFSTKK